MKINMVAIIIDIVIIIATIIIMASHGKSGKG